MSKLTVQCTSATLKALSKVGFVPHDNYSTALQWPAQEGLFAKHPSTGALIHARENNNAEVMDLEITGIPDGYRKGMMIALAGGMT